MSKSKNGTLPLIDEDDLPTLPEGWTWVKSNDLFSFVTSGSRGWAKYYADEGPLFLRIGNLDHASISLDVEKLQRVSPPESAETERTRVQAGDLLISVTADVGMIGVVPEGFETAHINQHIALSRPIEGIARKYLAWFLASESGGQRQFKALQRGATKAGLGLDDIRNVDVPIAPPKEQKRIVAKIEELFSDLDAGVSALERARANLRRYRASVLKSAVEGRLTKKWRFANPGVEPASELLARILRERRQRWEQQQLATYESKGKKPPKNWQSKYKEPAAPDTNNLPELPNGWVWATPEQLAAHEDYSLAIGPFGSNLKVSDYTDEGVPLVFVRNIRSGQFGDDGKKAKYVSPEKADELFAHSVDGGDVLITKMGEPPGDATLYPKSEPHAIITADCIKFRPSPLAGDPNYFVWAINSQPVHNQILKITRGVAQKKVSLGRFATIAFPLPPVQEQEQLLRHLESSEDSANKIEETFQRSESRSDRLRQSILKTAFEGQLCALNGATK